MNLGGLSEQPDKRQLFTLVQRFDQHLPVVVTPLIQVDRFVGAARSRHLRDQHHKLPLPRRMQQPHILHHLPQTRALQRRLQHLGHRQRIAHGKKLRLGPRPHCILQRFGSGPHRLLWRKPRNLLQRHRAKRTRPRQHQRSQPHRPPSPLPVSQLALHHRRQRLNRSNLILRARQEIPVNHHQIRILARLE
jgi:hypothetical protein